VRLVELATIALIASTVAYLALVVELFRYVKSHQPAAWHRLGEPWPWGPAPWNVWRAVVFVFFGGVFEIWSDPKVRIRAIAVWVLFALAVATLIVAKQSAPGSGSAAAEEFFDVGELEFDVGRAAVVALAAQGRCFHFAQECVHFFEG
jgi:hypothetical protein